MRRTCSREPQTSLPVITNQALLGLQPQPHKAGIPLMEHRQMATSSQFAWRGQTILALQASLSGIQSPSPVSLGILHGLPANPLPPAVCTQNTCQRDPIASTCHPSAENPPSFQVKVLTLAPKPVVSRLPVHSVVS